MSSSSPEPSKKTICMDRIEVYATLANFQFIETQRFYMCTDVRLINITNFFQKKIEELAIIVYENVDLAILCELAQKYIADKKPILFATIEKVSNKKEKHEIVCCSVILYMEGNRYTSNKGFIRAELDKSVPTRLQIDY